MNSNVLNYEGRGIAFELIGQNNNDLMINATEILKNYPNKRMSDFLSSKQTSELIAQVESETGISASQLVVVVKGNYSDGRMQGTWMYRKIALAFALWVDVKFFSWCLDVLDSYITQFYNNGLATKDAEINRLHSLLARQQPQINYYNQVLCNPEALYSTNQIVKQLGLKISNRNLLKMMSDNGMIYKDLGDNQWYVTSTYAKNRYRIATTIRDHTGKIRSVNRWTEAGKYWIWSLALGWKLI